MIAELISPFGYEYMVKAMWVSALVGGVCAFLSAYLMLKGWSLIGDALSHAIVPGVAAAYMLGLPFAAGAFIAGGLAAGDSEIMNRPRPKKEVKMSPMMASSLSLVRWLRNSMAAAARPPEKNAPMENGRPSM